MLSAHQIDAYHRDGFLLYPSLLDSDLTSYLRDAAKSDASLRDNTLERGDGEGGSTKLALWNNASDDMLGLVGRYATLVEAAEQLIGEEVYHWHSKVIQKEAHSGGAWAWHQDYGYWYNDHVLFPRMLSCFVAIDPATVENGCLQVLKGSHHLGRINHGPVGDQTGADPQRVDAAQRQCELVYCEMQPGDALFFHCNLLHRSDQNRSPNPRWALICCYNAASNSPIAQTWQPSYSPIDRVSPETLRQTAQLGKTEISRAYLNR